MDGTPTGRFAELVRAPEPVLREHLDEAALLIAAHANLGLDVEHYRGRLDDLAARDARVRVFHHATPGGAPRARNLAIREARAEWVTGIDDDDEFMPGRLAALSAVAQAFETSGVKFSLLYTQDEVVSPHRTGTTRKPCWRQTRSW